MVTKSLLNQIKNLKNKKYRNETRLFVAEGKKLVYDLYKSKIKCITILTTHNTKLFPFQKVEKSQMKKISYLKTPSSYLGVFKIPEFTFDIRNINNSIIALDGITDPGNLGTIIRTCDWFGIKDIICSKNSVDCFNSKVVQSSMGSIANVKCHYIDLAKFLKTTKFSKCAVSLEGKSLYKSSLTDNSIFIFGSESKGISLEVREEIMKSITIPKSKTNQSIDSLNLASSVAVVLSEKLRQSR
tara:strand:- start:1872 stop:2597 length:726 start_codon:yes stop_codon:yes gene_type:complete